MTRSKAVTITLTDEGFVLTGGRSGEKRIRWSDVEEIIAFKRDLITTDQLCLGLRISGSDVYEFVDEETPGFSELDSALGVKLASYQSDWKETVVHPPFASNLTTIFRRVQKDL